MGIAAQDDLARAYAVPDGMFYIDLLQPRQGGNGQIHSRSSVLWDHNGNLIFAYAPALWCPAPLRGLTFHDVPSFFRPQKERLVAFGHSHEVALVGIRQRGQYLSLIHISEPTRPY